ncbi:MAG: hypothetical protein IRZ28_20530 [Steroidobacteraceae bacterium]|nr:hypothetical protein [Steroidobacteraceae bacterium]
MTEPSDRNSQERSSKDTDKDAGKTPGRARDAASRQQTHPDQGLQSGSPDLDEDATRRTDTPAVPTVPPGPK